MSEAQVEGDPPAEPTTGAPPPRRSIFRSCLLLLGIGFLVIVGIGFLGGRTFLPSDVHIERSIQIDAPAEIVFGEIDDVRRWERWSPWHKLDPNATYTYLYNAEGASRGQNAGYMWKGNDEVGSGKLTITESTPNTHIVTALSFNQKGREPSRATAAFTLEEVDGGTKVTWGFDTKMKGMEKFFGLVMNNLLGPQYEQGLAGLKEVAEAEVGNPTPHAKSLPIIEPGEPTDDTDINSTSQ